MRRTGWWTFLRCVVLIAGTTGVLFAVMAAATSSPASAATPGSVAADGGVLGPLNPADANGITIDHYDITADNGGALDFGRKVLIFFTNAAFAINRWVVGLASWLVEWVLDFKITNYLLGPVIKLSQVLESHLIIGTGLGAFALTLAAVVCGMWVLRGRRSKGLTEFAVTLVIAAFAATYISSPASTVFGPTGLLGKTRDLSLEVGSLVITDGRSSTGGSAKVTSEVRAMFVDTFVRKPHQLINYGELFDADPQRPHRCLRVYNDLLADGPWGSSPEPRTRMTACDPELADFNREATWDRLGAALLSVIAALFVGVLAILISLTLLASQLWLVLETIRLLFALVIGLVPGPGRRQLWKAIGGLAAALAGVIATIVSLMLYVVVVRALLTAAGNQWLFVRFLLLDVAIFCGFAWYKKLLAGSRSVAARISTRFGGAPAAATPPSVIPTYRQGRAELARVANAVRTGVRPLRRPSRAAGRHLQSWLLSKVRLSQPGTSSQSPPEEPVTEQPTRRRRRAPQRRMPVNRRPDRTTTEAERPKRRRSSREPAKRPSRSLKKSRSRRAAKAETKAAKKPRQTCTAATAANVAQRRKASVARSRRTAERQRRRLRTRKAAQATPKRRPGRK
ncbi:hypothetical protein [Flindersiella endophytica]